MFREHRFFVYVLSSFSIYLCLFVFRGGGSRAHRFSRRSLISSDGVVLFMHSKKSLLLRTCIRVQGSGFRFQGSSCCSRGAVQTVLKVAA